MNTQALWLPIRTVSGHTAAMKDAMGKRMQ
jgi:hypothetical protein